MKAFIKIILVLNLAVSLYRNLLLAPQYYPAFNKKSLLFYFTRKLGDNTPTHYFNYYLALTGLTTGYRFYAPDVPNAVKIEFTIQSATENKTCSIGLNTTEAKKRFDIMGDHFYFNQDARPLIAGTLARYMFHIFPGAQQIIVTAYTQPIPTPNDYLEGIHMLKPALIASYTFNKI